jgi:hypothetical protein
MKRYLIEFWDAILTTTSVHTYTSPMNILSREEKNGWSNFCLKHLLSSFHLESIIKKRRKLSSRRYGYMKKETNLWSLTYVHFSYLLFWFKYTCPIYTDEYKRKKKYNIVDIFVLEKKEVLGHVHICGPSWPSPLTFLEAVYTYIYLFSLTKDSWLTWSSNLDHLIDSFEHMDECMRLR